MIQLQVLNKLLDTKDKSIITANNLNEDFFSDYKNEYKFIKDHIDKYQTIPDKESFLSKFPTFDIIKVNENSSMWSNKIPIEYGFGKNMFGFH